MNTSGSSSHTPVQLKGRGYTTCTSLMTLMWFRCHILHLTPTQFNGTLRAPDEIMHTCQPPSLNMQDKQIKICRILTEVAGQPILSQYHHAKRHNMIGILIANCYFLLAGLRDEQECVLTVLRSIAPC